MKCPFCIKICTKCKRILVANKINFCKKKNGKWGLSSRCKECDKKRNKKYYDDNKEEILEQKKQYYNDNKEVISKQKKQYYNDNKEEKKEYSKKYRNNHKEEISENKKRYHKDNPEKIFNNRNRRRKKEKSQGNGINKDQWYEMMNFFDWKCAYSGIEFSWNNKENDRSIDHVIPLNEGGENEIWNCVPMLKDYNSSKSTKNMEDWYMQQDFFDIDRLLKIYEWIEYSYKKWGGVNND